jgi:hypothetical protein
MADCSCDFCKLDEKCPYAYDESDCVVLAIKKAREVVDLEFITFYEKLKAKNETLDDDYIEMLVKQMDNIIYNSRQPISDFILEEIS